MHPEFLNQFVAKQIRFAQQSDLVFEDPYLGVTASRVFPNQDRIQQGLQTERLGPSIQISDIRDLEFEAVDEPPTSNVAPPFDLFLDTTSTYDRLVERIYVDTGRDPSMLDEAQRDTLHYLGRFHAFLQRELPGERATVATSINRLQDAVGAFDPEETDPVKMALMEGYETKLGDEADLTSLMNEFEDGGLMKDYRRSN
jgi:hypothetical protein